LVVIKQQAIIDINFMSKALGDFLTINSFFQIVENWQLS